MTVDLGVQLTCTRRGMCVVSTVELRIAVASQRNSDTRNARTKAALKCYECEEMGHFKRACATRQRKKRNPSTRREGGTPESVPDAHVPPTDPIRSKEGRQEVNNKPSGKRIGGEKADSSFHLSGPENAVKRFSVSVLLEQSGTRGTQVFTEGKAWHSSLPGQKEALRTDDQLSAGPIMS